MIKPIQQLREQVKESYSLLSTETEKDLFIMSQYEKLDKALSKAETTILAIKYLEQ